MKLIVENSCFLPHDTQAFTSTQFFKTSGGAKTFPVNNFKKQQISSYATEFRLDIEELEYEPLKKLQWSRHGFKGEESHELIKENLIVETWRSLGYFMRNGSKIAYVVLMIDDSVNNSLNGSIIGEEQWIISLAFEQTVLKGYKNYNNLKFKK